MIFQWFFFTLGSAYNWLVVGATLPQDTWVLFQNVLNAFRALVAFFPPIPYIPYGTVSVAFGLYMTSFVAALLVSLIAWVVNMFVRVKTWAG